VAETGPVGAFLVELLVYTGGLFKNHWAYFVRSHTNRDIGIMIHAAGDVMNGFKFEIKRCHDFQATGNHPSQRIPLQWVDAKYFDEKAMFNNGVRVVVDQPVGGFEISAAKVKVPSKSLNTTNVVVSHSFRFDLPHNSCPRDTCLPSLYLLLGICFRDPVLRTYFAVYSFRNISAN
jgi:hypothetical protein